jgi:hypothetical protein
VELEVLLEGVLDGSSHSIAGQMHPTWLVDRDQRFVQSITRDRSDAIGIGMIDCFDIASEQEFKFESTILCING